MRPNILLILVDQMVIDAISAYRDHFPHPAWGCHWLQTPNLDHLVRRGSSFLHSNSNNPVCSPARSALFTGRMSIETGVVRNNIGIDENVPNMGQWFAQHSDYDRVYCGKWHAGGRWNCPEVSGDRKIPGFDILPIADAGVGHIIDYQVSNSVEAYVRNYRGGNPFLLVAGLFNPHDICFWTPPYHARNRTAVTEPGTFDLGDRLPILPPNLYSEFPRPERVRGPVEAYSELTWRHYAYDYYRMVEQVDKDVGRMLDAVEARTDETVVIFTSDHGDGLGRHRMVEKWHPYDESMRVPLILHCPGRIREGVIDAEHPVSTVDIMSTVCDYAGIPEPPHARGLSLRPIISRDASAGPTSVPWRDHIYAEVDVTGRIIRSRRFKYVMFYRFSGDFEKPFGRTSDGSATQFEPGHGPDYEQDPVTMLFDMEGDPWETENLSSDPRYTDVLADHADMLREWERRLIPGVHFDRN